MVLFDAIEDAAFPVVNNMDGIGTLRSLKEKASSSGKLEVLREYLQEFKVRIVLTAPNPVLSWCGFRYYHRFRTSYKSQRFGDN